MSTYPDFNRSEIATDEETYLIINMSRLVFTFEEYMSGKLKLGWAISTVLYTDKEKAVTELLRLARLNPEDDFRLFTSTDRAICKMHDNSVVAMITPMRPEQLPAIKRRRKAKAATI